MESDCGLSPEPVGEQLVDLMADALLARSDPHERQGSPYRRDITAGGVRSEHFTSELLDRHPAHGRCSFQAAMNLCGDVQVEDQTASVRKVNDSHEV